MSQADQPEQDEQHTTTLHLGKFAPKAGEAAPTPPAPEDTATIVIKKFAAQVASTQEQPVVVPKAAGNALPPKDMLGAVSYAYAKGVYRSEDIERKMVHDPELRKALGNEVPDASAIRRFRRLNREAIVKTLEVFFRWARRRPAPEGTAQGAPQAPARNRDFSESTVIMTHKAAADRLDKAMWVDNMAKEEE
jgi:hypothetical protein